MTVFEYFHQCAEQIEKLDNAGMLKYKVWYYFAIYSRYLVYLEMGNSKTASVKQASSDFHVTERRGWEAINEMSKQI
jgi:hypothetical protein